MGMQTKPGWDRRGVRRAVRFLSSSIVDRVATFLPLSVHSHCQTECVTLLDSGPLRH